MRQNFLCLLLSVTALTYEAKSDSWIKLKHFSVKSGDEQLLNLRSLLEVDHVNLRLSIMPEDHFEAPEINCENLTPLHHLCPLDANVKIETFRSNGIETDHGHLCSTYANVDFECVVTLNENGISGVQDGPDGIPIDFIVSTCEADPDANCALINNEEAELNCAFSDVSEEIESKTYIITRKLTRLDPWIGCHDEMSRLQSFGIGIAIGPTLFNGKLKGSKKQALKWIETVVSEANVIYTQQLNTKLQVKHVLIAESESRNFPFPAWANDGCAKTIFDQLKDFATTTDRSSQGLWHLFDDCHDKHGSSQPIGVAYRGVLCRSRFNKGVTFKHDFSKTWLTFAHEIGHNFGAKHSFEEGRGSTGGIMDYGDKILSAAHPEFQFNRKFREEDICSHISRSLDTCIHWSKSKNDHYCGNGVIEADEECECVKDVTTCDCCENCKLKANADCDPLHNECCNDECSFKTTRSSCFSSSGDGYCRDGFCATPACERFGLGDFCGIHDDNGCRFKCIHQKKCETMNGWLSNGDPINHIRDGTRCEIQGQFGICKKGSCARSSYQSPVIDDINVKEDSEEEEDSLLEISEKCCKEAREKFGSRNFRLGKEEFSGVCADARWKRQGCAKGEFRAVEKICNENGLRLCNENELKSNILSSSGCNSSRKQYWTSSKCELDSSDISGYLVLKGLSAEESTCESVDNIFSLACCADVCT